MGAYLCHLKTGRLTKLPDSEKRVVVGDGRRTAAMYSVSCVI